MNLVRRRLKPFASAIAALSFLAAPAAEAMTVQPVVIDLATAGRAMGDVIIVENTFDRPLAVELSVQTLELTDGADDVLERLTAIHLTEIRDMAPRLIDILRRLEEAREANA